MIATAMIETIWREKTRHDRIKETIQEAFCEIYRGSFDEIIELDEEQLYSSYLNSGMNTERLLTDNNWSTIQKNMGGKNNSPKEIKNFAEFEDKEKHLWNSEARASDRLMTQAKYDHIGLTDIKILVKPSVENVIDDDFEETRGNKVNDMAINLQNPYVNGKIHFQDLKIDDKEVQDVKLCKVNIAKATWNFDINEDDKNQPTAPDLRSRDHIDTPNSQYYKHNVGEKQKLNDINNLNKLKQITLNSSFKKKKALASSRGHASTKQLSKMTLSKNRQVSLSHLNISFRKDYQSKPFKPEFNNMVAPKMLKSLNNETSKLGRNLVSRNRSANSHKEKISHINPDIPRCEPQEFIHKRRDVDSNRIDFSRGEIPSATKR